MSGAENVGGLVGENQRATINNSYATGDVSGECCGGGLIGTNYGGTVNNSSATGVVSGDDNVGELIGKDVPYEPDEEVHWDPIPIPGFTKMLWLVASVIAVAIYQRKSKKQ